MFSSWQSIFEPGNEVKNPLITIKSMVTKQFMKTKLRFALKLKYIGSALTNATSVPRLIIRVTLQREVFMVQTRLSAISRKKNH